MQVKTVQEFDNLFTAKVMGYATGSEYHRFGSCAFDIPYIHVPTLLITDLDDPIAAKEVIPWDEIKQNPNVILAQTQNGGHLGWFEGGIIPGRRWFVTPVGEFTEAIFEAALSLPEDQMIIKDNVRARKLPKSTCKFVKHKSVTTDAQQPDSVQFLIRKADAFRKIISVLVRLVGLPLVTVLVSKYFRRR